MTAQRQRTGFEKLYPTDTNLTPEQQDEFDTPLLKTFAESYLKFRHSSPSTGKRPAYRYFEPLPPEKMTDADILYGPDREKSYGRLMADFMACRMAGEFKKFFDEGHKIWWKSRTVPGLLLFKKWIDGGSEKS